VKLGQKMHTCPYYGTRKGVKSAEVINMDISIMLIDDSLWLSLTTHSCIKLLETL
jgi:hypothetical protein